MPEQNQDISNIEDIGERLDALLDVLEASTNEVARVGASLGKPLGEIETEEAVTSNAMLDDSGRAVKMPGNKTSGPAKAPPDDAPQGEAARGESGETEPESGETGSSVSSSSESSSDASGGAEPPAADPEATQSEIAEPDSAATGEFDSPEPPAPAEQAPAEQAGASSPEPAPAEPEQPEAHANAAAEPDLSASEEFPPVEADPDLADVVEAEPVLEAQPEETDAQVDDGLLIEPEGAEALTTPGDIDGAPAGPADLESELDAELEALLASGMFEDPLAAMEAGESAPPLDLPEDEPKADAFAPDESTVRMPNLPSDEAELIGELDEQLAALADAELAESESAEPPAAVEAPPAGAAPEPAAASPAPEPAPTAAARPGVSSSPVSPAGRGFKARAAAAIEHARPHVARGMRRTRELAIAGATRANAPLQNRPLAKQVVGWVALVHVFYAICVWAYVALWHDPPAPAPAIGPPTLQGQPSQ